MSIDPRSSRRSGGGWGWALLVVCALVSGCGRPQIQPANQRITASLRTALSARNTQWLEQNAALIEQRHRSGELSAEEYEALEPIVARARDGQWREAEEAVVALQRAQRPTNEQVERVERPKSRD